MGDAKRVVVTGAAGFVGSHVAEHLAREGRDVTGIDNFDPFYSLVDKERNVDLLARTGVDVRRCDLRDHDETVALLDALRPDAVVHLAAKAGVRESVRHPAACIETNVGGTSNVLDGCRLAGISTVVMASTSSVYGATTRVPFVEDDPCDRPPHPYAASKRSAELLAASFAGLYDIDVTVTRLFTVYGERGRPDMMPRLLVDSVTSGRAVPRFDGPLARDWTHVEDVVRGLAAAIDRASGFRILNLGRGRPVLLDDFVATLEAVSGRRANLVPTPRPPSEILATHADIGAARDHLGYEPRIDVEEGIRRLWAWWDARPDGPT